MPSFDTPEPIAVTLDLASAHVRIAAGERADTVVEVRPSDPSHGPDVRSAEQTRVEYADGRLLVKTSKPRGLFSLRNESIEVAIELPAGSQLQGHAGAGEIVCEGRLGRCALKVGDGSIRIEQAGPLRLVTGRGTISVGRVAGDADAATASGDVQIGDVEGSARVKNSNGDTHLGAVDGDLRLTAANGDIAVERAGASVSAKTANGDIRIGEVARGSVDIQTGLGTLEVGVREGTAAWLDVSSGFGAVQSSLEPSGRPEDSDEKVEVRARTGAGDIVVRRS
jgi:DUF4097 and DUF4098 domain-containing protein YvlB